MDNSKSQSGEVASSNEPIIQKPPVSISPPKPVAPPSIHKAEELVILPSTTNVKKDPQTLVLWVQAAIACLTIIVLILQFMVLKSTDDKFGRQLGVMRDQTEVLKKQTEFMINHDRPYVEPESVGVIDMSSNNPSFFIRFKNTGGSRAYNITVFTGLYFWQGNDFSVAADFKDSLLNGYKYGDVSVDGFFKMNIVSAIPEKFIRAADSGTGVAYVFGKYRYSDWNKKTDTASFCFYYNPFQKSFPFCSSKDDYKRPGIPFYQEAMLKKGKKPTP